MIATDPPTAVYIYAAAWVALLVVAYVVHRWNESHKRRAEAAYGDGYRAGRAENEHEPPPR